MAGLRKRTWKKKDGTITSRWELSYNIDGKQYKKTYKTKPTPQEMAEATQRIAYNPTFRQFIKNEYLEKNLKFHCKNSTLETYENYIKKILPPLYPYKLKDIKRRNIENFILSLKSAYSPKTINNVLVFIKGAFNYALEMKIISENPANKINQIPLEKKRAKVLTQEQLKIFKGLLETKPLWVKVFFTVLLDTGMRISECIALEWKDINFEKKTMKISKQFYRYRLTSTKNYETREIEIPDKLIELLSLYKTKCKSERLIFSINADDYISSNNIRERHFAPMIEEIEEQLDEDLSGITPHCLRHTHASTLLSAGIPLKYVSRRLGHKDQKTTLNIYDHILPADNEKAIEFLNKIS